jgi:hypothetical protein
MKLADADRKKLPGLLGELGRAVEDLMLSGLTTASEATRQTLQVAFQEASRLRLLRLGSTLRVANEELGRFTRNEADFSRKRLCFFLNRAWLLSRGLAHAMEAGDDAEFDRLLWTPASEALDRLEVVTLGVAKKVATGAFVAFEFRLRAVTPHPQPLSPKGRGEPSQQPLSPKGTGEPSKLKEGQRLTWSCVFPVKAGVDIPPEGFLHLPQKQKFNASIFLDKKVLSISKAAVAVDESGHGRISLGDASTVTAGAEFKDWQRFLTWDTAAAVQRIRRHEPGPLDLEVEMQEEVVLQDWELQEPKEREEEKQWSYPIVAGAVPFEAIVSQGIEGKALRTKLEEQRKKKRHPPLFALMHYEKCRLVLQPLTLFGKGGPEYLTISDEKLERAALLKALKFT